MGNFKSLENVQNPHEIGPVWQIIIQLFLSGFTKNRWQLERSRKDLSNGTNLAFLAQFVQKLQAKQDWLSKKWKNSTTCTLWRYKMWIFQKFPNRFFRFWSGFAQKYIYSEKNIVSRLKHFFKVITASKTPWAMRPKSQPWGPKPSLEAQNSALRPKF